jgi:hypothetical protein
MERQKLLAQKLAANRQRWLRTKYLEALPAPVRAELVPAEFLCVPDDGEVRRHSYISPRGVGYHAPVAPPGFAFREFSWPEQVFAALADYPDWHDGEPAYLWPPQVRPFPGQSMSDLLSGELPVFVVRFGWARHQLAALFEATQHGLALLSRSFGAGIVISVVCGYLEADPNPHERIYELGTWWRDSSAAPADPSKQMIGPKRGEKGDR